MKKNKGFSLVELIVVVLIMAIIAVVLAPQVTKWVNNSRNSSDLQLMDSASAFSQMALTDADAFDESMSGINIHIDNGKATITGEGGADVTSFATKFAEYAGVPTSELQGSGSSYTIDSIKTKSQGETIDIDINGGNVVATSSIENDDLEYSGDSPATGTPHEDGKTYYTVSFNTGGHGTVTSQSVEAGQKATNPGVLTASGYTFKGWYTDSTKTTEFNFDTPINSRTTIYAKWESDGTNPAGKITVTFTHKYNGKTHSETVRVEDGQTATSTWTPASDTSVTLETGEVWTTTDSKTLANVSNTNKSATINWTIDDRGKKITVTFTHKYKSKTFDESVVVNKGETATSTWTPASDTTVTLSEGEVWKTTDSKVLTAVSDTNKTATINWAVDDSGKLIEVTFTHNYKNKTYKEKTKVVKGSTATAVWTPASDTTVTLATGETWKLSSSSSLELKNVSDSKRSATINWEVDDSNVEYTVTFVHKLTGKTDIRERITVKKRQTATSTWTNANAGESGHWNQSGKYTHTGELSVSNVTADTTVNINWKKSIQYKVNVYHYLVHDGYPYRIEGWEEVKMTDDDGNYTVTDHSTGTNLTLNNSNGKYGYAVSLSGKATKDMDVYVLWDVASYRYMYSIPMDVYSNSSNEIYVWTNGLSSTTLNGYYYYDGYVYPHTWYVRELTKYTKKTHGSGGSKWYDYQPTTTKITYYSWD